jgi:hypothetical protein
MHLHRFDVARKIEVRVQIKAVQRCTAAVHVARTRAGTVVAAAAGA